MATKQKNVLSMNGNEVTVFAGFDQEGFVDGSVCRMGAEFMADIAEIADIDVSKRKTAVTNTMNELIRCFNKVYGTRVNAAEFDFRSGKYSRTQNKKPQKEQQPQPTQPQQEVQVPKMATADTSSVKVPELKQKPTKVDAFYKPMAELVKMGHSLFDVKQAFMEANPTETKIIENQAILISEEGK